MKVKACGMDEQAATALIISTAAWVRRRNGAGPEPLLLSEVAASRYCHGEEVDAQLLVA